MPRKFWVQKNRYCWKSNLTEQEFLCLLRLYGVGYTCTKSAVIMARYARRFGCRKVSRQTINRYFLLFGDYLYGMLPERFQVENIPLEPPGEDEGDLAQMPKHEMNALVVLSAVHGVLYERLAWNDDINKIILSNKTHPVFHWLKAFSRAKRGYPIETFCAHFAYSQWSLLISSLRPDEPIWKALFALMRDAMEEHPLDMRTHRSLRILKPGKAAKSQAAA